MTIADSEMIGLFISLAAMWHVLGFAFGLVYVYFSLKSLFKLIPYERKWSHVIRGADLHLWLSGCALIGLGMLEKGMDAYLSNPKLWGKFTVIILWFLSTQSIRHVGMPYFRKGQINPMIQCSALNISCWLYGAFLGCAKPLSYGVSYVQFLAGFIVVIMVSSISLFMLKKHLSI